MPQAEVAYFRERDEKRLAEMQSKSEGQRTQREQAEARCLLLTECIQLGCV